MKGAVGITLVPEGAAAEVGLGDTVRGLAAYAAFVFRVSNMIKR